MAEAARRLMTVEEFLDWDDGTDRRYELVDGIVRMMVTPLDNHGTIVANITIAIGRHLRPECRVVTESGLVPKNRSRSYYEADLSVTCAPPVPGGTRPVPDPLVVIEVLSPSTEKFDRDRKALDYRSLPSVEEIVLVSTSVRRVEIWRRVGERWIGIDFIGDAVARFECLGIDVPLADIYRNVAFATDDAETGGALLEPSQG